MATVDVIIPAYNGHDMINRALASCAMQKLDDGDSFKVTIVNDASPDGDYHAYVTYWSSLMDICEVDKIENEGCGQARQTGMDMTDGDYFMFLDVDDTLASPIAIRSLLRAIKDGDNDLAMGEFMEETAEGKFIRHQENWIWCHGKLYKRRFIDRFKLRFNLTRGCEDVGFHSVMNKLTDRVKVITQTVYLWESCNSSLVRHDHVGYSYGYGWRDFVENMAWAVEELQSRNINKSLIRDQVGAGLSRIYIQYNEGAQLIPSEKEENWAKVQDYYNRAVKWMVVDGGFDYDQARDYLLDMQKNNGGQTFVVPDITFRQFLTNLGYFEDLKAVNNDGD